MARRPIDDAAEERTTIDPNSTKMTQVEMDEGQLKAAATAIKLEAAAEMEPADAELEDVSAEAAELEIATASKANTAEGDTNTIMNTAEGGLKSMAIDLQEQAAQFEVSNNLDGDQISGDGAAARIANADVYLKDAQRPHLEITLDFLEEAGHHLDETLTQALDVSAKQGVATPGPDETISSPFIPGSAVLSEAEPDEDDLKPLNTEDA